ncbi:MAG: tRNA (adenosine(37)-N6)-threonylcarbamoyltransferase complex ATPase subunit type 1 TsaE [Bacteroidales bacterium]
MKTIEINSLDELRAAAQNFISLTSGFKRFAFYGSMGSGKTTLIKAICKELGAVDVITSPTFSLVNEYQTTTGETLYHFDLYRIKSTDELFDLGYEEYFYSRHYVFIEWAEKAEELLPDSCVKVSIEETDPSKRMIHIEL